MAAYSERVVLRISDGEILEGVQGWFGSNRRRHTRLYRSLWPLSTLRQIQAWR